MAEVATISEEASAERIKRQLLTRESPSDVRDISDAVVIKGDALFFLTDRGGEVPFDDHHGLGLYYRDCRFLNGYRVRLAGQRPECLGVSSAQGFGASLVLTNQQAEIRGSKLAKERVSLRWHRVIDDVAGALRDEIRLENHAQEPVRLPLTLEFRSGFEDVLAVRGLLDGDAPGRMHPPRQEGTTLLLSYDGIDDTRRSTKIELEPDPREWDGTCAELEIELEPREVKSVRVTIEVVEEPIQGGENTLRDDRTTRRHREAESPQEQVDLERLLEDASEQWLRIHADVDTDSIMVDRVLGRSLRDLGTLLTHLEGGDFYAAGVPWFGVLFGRDSVLAALQTLAFTPEMSADTLRLLARFQGRRHDDWPEEQPGKILHVLRVGEHARAGAIPLAPYYGSVDATPLFLILVARQAEWSGSLELFHDLREPVDRALEWVMSIGAGADGLIRYTSDRERGLINQGWKDAGDSIMDRDGRIARPPIAMVEVQAYAVEACRAMSRLFERTGEEERASSLSGHAQRLQELLEERFWSEELGTYDMALQEDDEPTGVVTSNAGHVLWARAAATPERARRTVDRLMQSDMFNGWGVRTLSAQAKAYNPVGYHRGTVWPHDNSLLVAGFRAYGQDEAALRVFDGILSAASFFENGRLPELFAGFGQEALEFPVKYPVACHPQAWAAGAVPYMLTTLLGLRPEGFERRLRVVRPILPDYVDRLTLKDVKVGGGECDLHFTREDHRARVEVRRVEGVEVVVEDEEQARWD